MERETCWLLLMQVSIGDLGDGVLRHWNWRPRTSLITTERRPAGPVASVQSAPLASLPSPPAHWTKAKGKNKPSENKAFLFCYHEILLKQNPHSLLALGFENVGPQAVSDSEGLRPMPVDSKSLFRSQHVTMCPTLMTLLISNNRADEVILQLMFPGI